MSKYVEKNLSGLNQSKLIELEINTQASEYFVNNYEYIMGQARRMVGVDPNKVEDLVQDVLVSIMTSEAAGEGYDMSHSNAGSIITVAEFVFGRLKLYSKNNKYKAEGCDRKVKTKRMGNEVKSTVVFDLAFASPDDSKDLDDLDGFQKAYANAHCYDSEISDIEDGMSLRQDIEFCMDFDEVVGFKFINLFKNLDMFTDNFDNSIFDKLKDAMKYHDELNDAVFNVLSAAARHRNLFDSIVAEF